MKTQPMENHYLILIKGTEWHHNLSPEELQQAMEGMSAWFERLESEGRIKGGHPLANEGRVVSASPKGVVADGPFAESKEAVGGFIMIEAASIEEAVEYARSSPSLKYGLTLEVRPVMEECPMQAHLRELQAQAKA